LLRRKPSAAGVGRKKKRADLCRAPDGTSVIQSISPTDTSTKILAVNATLQQFATIRNRVNL
jgi:hypothetical protein